MFEASNERFRDCKNDRSETDKNSFFLCKNVLLYELNFRMADFLQGKIGFLSFLIIASFSCTLLKIYFCLGILLFYSLKLWLMINLFFIEFCSNKSMLLFVFIQAKCFNCTETNIMWMDMQHTKCCMNMDKKFLKTNYHKFCWLDWLFAHFSNKITNFSTIQLMVIMLTKLFSHSFLQYNWRLCSTMFWTRFLR